MFVPRVRLASLLTLALLGGVLVVLAIAWGVGMLLRRQVDTTLNPALVQLFNRRIQAWLLMYVIFASGFVLGRGATTLLFFFVSFFALREFITITPTRLGDHRALFALPEERQLDHHVDAV